MPTGVAIVSWPTNSRNAVEGDRLGPMRPYGSTDEVKTLARRCRRRPPQAAALVGRDQHHVGRDRVGHEATDRCVHLRHERRAPLRGVERLARHLVAVEAGPARTFVPPVDLQPYEGFQRPVAAVERVDAIPRDARIVAVAADVIGDQPVVVEIVAGGFAAAL